MVHTSIASLLDSPGPLMGPRVAALLPELIEFRRQVHRNPELSFQEKESTKRIVQHLEQAGMHPTLFEGTGCFVDIGRGPFALALRADIDALPLQEKTGLPYASQVPGVMHACGHDIHQTVMLGVALALKDLDRQLSLDRSVRIIFQPAEEQLPGGAVDVIGQGALRGIPRAFALHCEPKVDVGKIASRIGAITSATDTIKIRLHGHGGHTSRPHLTEDLIYAMGQLAVGVPAVLSRRMDARSGILLTWGQIAAGVTPNAIAAEGVLAGTLGCLDADAWYRAGEILDDVIEQVAAPYGVRVELEHVRGVPPVVNTEEETAMVESAARTELGEDAVQLVEQSMGGEDFAWMLQEVPGAMIRLGTRTPGGPTYDLHQGDFIPDERAIGYGVQVMATAALRAVRWEQAKLSAQQFRSSSNYG